MTRKILPGVMLTLVMAVVFSLPGYWALPRERGTPPVVSALPTRSSRPITSANATGLAIAESRRDRSRQQAGENLGHDVPVALSAAGEVAELAFPVHADWPAALPPIGYGNAVASANALASVMDYKYSDGEPRYQTSDKRGKGLFAWISGEELRDTQKPSLNGFSHYEGTGKKYGVGIMYDWSIDSTIGISVDKLNYQIASRHDEDNRKSDIDGYVAAVHYLGSFRGKFPFGMSAFFGSSKATGGGSLYRVKPGVTDIHHEQEYSSRLGGFSGQISLPLIFGDDIKVTPELAARYSRLRTKAREIAIQDTGTSIFVPDMSSASFSVPLTVEAKKEFERCWGLITPRLGAGVVVELRDNALGLRTHHASAAGSVVYDSTYTPTGLAYEQDEKMFYQVAMGMEVKTNGGWQLNAGYTRRWARQYVNNTIRLELGRCF